MSRAPRVDAVILAAGTSSRLGRPKQLLDVGGRALVQRVVDAALGSSVTRVVVVTGAASEDVRAAVAPDARLRFADNNVYESGQASSLAAGIRALDSETEAAVVLLGDQPGVSSALIDRLIAEFAATDKPVVRPIFAAAGRRVPGHPVIFARSFWPEVLALSGDEGARAVLDARSGDVLEVTIEDQAPRDIDTEADYAAVLAEPRDSYDRRAGWR